MWFLIGQILLLLVLAAALGVALGIWWVKRRYEDVTETHDNLLMQTSKLDALKDLPTRDDMKAGLGQVSSSLASLRMPDLSPVNERLASVEQAVKGFVVPPTDFTPLNRRLELIESMLKAPDVALDQVRTRIGAIESMISQVSQSVSRLGNTDLSPVVARLSDLETALLSWHMPEVDLGPVHASLARLGLSIDDLKTRTFLDGVNGQLSDVRGAVIELTERIQTARADGARLDATRKADLDALMSRVTALASDVQGLHPIEGALGDVNRAVAALDRSLGVIQPELDAQHRRALAPVERGIAGLQEAVGSLPQPDLAPVLDAVHAIDSREDLAAVENRLTAIEYSLAALHHMLRSRSDGAPGRSDLPWQGRTAPSGDIRLVRPIEPTPAVAPAPPPREFDPINPVRRPGDKANLLVEPAFGPADNLEQINGVGPILRSILNERGIYYFWQVAEWTPDDIVFVDQQLLQFRGRIQRDDWVSRARILAALPTSAKRPMGHYGRRETP